MPFILFKIILHIKKQTANSYEWPEFWLLYEVNGQVRLNLDAPKSSQKQFQPCCVRRISETNLPGDAGTPKPLCSCSRRESFAATFLQGS